MFLVGCQSIGISKSAPLVQTSTITISPKSFQTQTFTSLSDITPTDSIQPADKDFLKYECLNLAPNIPSSANLTGRLVLQNNQLDYFDFEKRSFQIISGSRGDLSVSPDGEWLAYYVISKDSPTGLWLTVENASGQQKRIPLQQDWYRGMGIKWLDNQRFVYNMWNAKTITPIYPIIVINPFTGVTQTLNSDYPNLVPKVWGMAGTMHFVNSTVVYDASLDLVVYPETNNNGEFVVLWDKNAQVALARVRDLGDFGHTPLWLPDESGYVIAVRNTQENDEWFMVSREGRVHQLTHFADSLSQTNIESASISPDGRYLAFWLESVPSSFPGYNLAIIDLETQQVTDYCIPGSSEAIIKPFWSPDSQYIVVGSIDVAKQLQVILIAPFARWAARIADDFTPYGWMRTTP